MLGFDFSIQSSVYGATSLWRYYCRESKPILYMDTVYFKFFLYLSVEIDRLGVNKHWQFITQTNFIYLGLVNVSMITGTCCS